MSRTTLAAPVLAVAASLIALTDAVTTGLTGQPSVFSAEGPGWAQVVSNAVHGLAFAVLAATLVRARLGGGRPRRWTGRALAVVLAVLAVPSLLDAVLPMEAAAEALSVPATAAFVLLFPLGAALGLMLRREPGLRVPALLLTLVLPAFVLTFVLGAVAPAWAHPAYAEVLLYLGVALLGTVRATTSAPSPAPVPAR